MTQSKQAAGTRKKFLKVTALVTGVGLAILLPVVLYYSTQPSLDEVAEELNAVPVPVQSRRIGTLYKSIEEGNSTCYKHASILVESELSIDELRKFYRRLVTPISLNPHSDTARNYNVEPTQLRGKVYKIGTWRDCGSLRLG